MNDAMVWLAMAGVLVILEIFSGTFYLLMIAVGALAGALAAWLGASNPVQMLAVAVVGVLACLLLYFVRGPRGRRREAANDPNVNLDIGQSVRVDQWQSEGNGLWQARVNYRGAQWDAQLQSEPGPGASLTPLPGWYVIREVRGSRLMLAANA